MTTSTLGHALLGLLARRPATGYELAGLLRRPVGHFWHARHSQIYPELGRLEAAGLVRHTVTTGAGPRPTKRYRITARGGRQLRQWLVSTAPDVDPREILVRVYSLWVLPQDEALEVLSAIRRHHEGVLASYREIRAGRRPPVGGGLLPTDPDFAARATLEWGISFEENRIRWCDWLTGSVRAGEWVEPQWVDTEWADLPWADLPSADRTGLPC